MPKTDIKAMIKDLEKNELTELISVAQEVLSTLFNSSEIRDNVKESRFSKGYECPKCQCKDVNKNGKSNGRQRYICKRCGTWLYITGDTYPVKEYLKNEFGAFWSKSKKCWCIAPEGKNFRKSKGFKGRNMSSIRNTYGSNKIKSEGTLLLETN